jgi:Resolvase, N terminal domain
VDSSSAAGRAFFGMLAAFAAFETDVRRERQLEGIAMAKREGAYKGGKPRFDRERVKELAKSGFGPAAIARELGMAQSGLSASRRGRGAARPDVLAAAAPGRAIRGAGCNASRSIAELVPLLAAPRPCQLSLR